jgi:hypothetical protein
MEEPEHRNEPVFLVDVKRSGWKNVIPRRIFFRNQKAFPPKPISEPRTPVQPLILNEYFYAKLLLTTPSLAERRSHRSQVPSIPKKRLIPSLLQRDDLMKLQSRHHGEWRIDISYYLYAR